jgi:hypothetical protein
LDTKDVALICLCYMENPTPAQIHYAVRRLRRRVPAATILIALLGATSAIDDEEIIHAFVKLDLVKASLRDTIERILAITAATSEPEDCIPTAARKTGDASPSDTSLIAGDKKPVLKSSDDGEGFEGEASLEGAPVRSSNSV